MTLPAYSGLQPYYGDLHAHCEIGYGQGSVEDAYANARRQLDFASVTAHWQWPDIPDGDARLANYVAWHRGGFARAAAGWPHLLDVTREVTEEGRFVAYPGFEWHSCRYGDHNVYYKEPRGGLLEAGDLPDLRRQLAALAATGLPGFLIPHHIGYAQGSRGANWDAFDPALTPVVEIVSMHGVAESDDAPSPYLLPMGPRSGTGTMQQGLARGLVFGVMGSTDHHGGFPGSYGCGRAAVWARDLTREGIWDAIAARRTYALTGDRIQLAFAVNGRPMGSLLPHSAERDIEVSVVGGGALDYVEVLHNNRTIHRWNGGDVPPGAGREPVKILLEMGWGPVGEAVDWQVSLEPVGARILSCEPRFRAPEVITIDQATGPVKATGEWRLAGEGRVEITTRTRGNPNGTTSETQAFCLEIDANAGAGIRAVINGRPVFVTVDQLLAGPVVGYLGGFRTPAYSFHRAAPRREYACDFSLAHRQESDRRDWYYARVRQKNGQWAWSSPVWVEAGGVATE